MHAHGARGVGGAIVAVAESIAVQRGATRICGQRGTPQCMPSYSVSHAHGGSSVDEPPLASHAPAWEQCDVLLASPVQSTAQLRPAKPASHSQSVPLPVASQLDDLPWPEHEREHWYEQSDVAKPEEQ